MSIELIPWFYCCCFTICNRSRVGRLPAAKKHLADDEGLAVEEAGGGVLAEVDAAAIGEPGPMKLHTQIQDNAATASNAVGIGVA